MSDIMLIGVLGMPYPDDVSNMDQISWYQLKCRLKEASSRINTENMIADEIEQIIEQLWNTAYLYGPSSKHIVGDEIISTSDIVQHVINQDVDNIIKKLQSIRNRLDQ